MLYYTKLYYISLYYTIQHNYTIQCCTTQNYTGLYRHCKTMQQMLTGVDVFWKHVDGAWPIWTDIVGFWRICLDPRSYDPPRVIFRRLDQSGGACGWYTYSPLSLSLSIYIDLSIYIFIYIYIYIYPPMSLLINGLLVGSGPRGRRASAAGTAEGPTIYYMLYAI